MLHLTCGGEVISAFGGREEVKEAADRGPEVTAASMRAYDPRRCLHFLASHRILDLPNEHAKNAGARKRRHMEEPSALTH